MGDVIDLFSCIGGHAIGYQRAGYKPLFFCENNPYRRDILARRFLGIPIYEDVKDVKGTKAFAAVGGPPCQRTSSGAAIHGYRTGETLWPEYFRIIQDSQLEWVLVEQPEDNAKWKAQVQSDLEGAGWAVEWLSISAQELGFPHIRRRSFAIANTSMPRLQAARSAIAQAVASYPRTAAARESWLSTIPGTIRMASGVPRGLAYRQMIEALGDSNPPEMMELIFKQLEGATAL